jgi:hypothetical protein
VCNPSCAAVNDNFCADPLFVGGGDYHLQSSSPAIDRGPAPALFDGSPCRDLDGGPRERDFDGDGMARRDVGAFEQVNDSLVPGEVPALTFTASNRFQWTPPAPPAPAQYHVYRDSVQSLGYANFGTCVDVLDADRTDTVFQDDGIPPPGVAWVYVVTAESTVGREGSMGLASCTERSLFAPCP